MTVEAIINRIQREAEEEVRSIRAEEACELTNIRNLAEQRAEAAYNHRLSEGFREIRQNIASQQSRTRIEAKKLVRESKEDLINQCFKETEKYLQTLRIKNEYPSLLKHLIEECMVNLGGQEHIISVHPDDRKIVQEIINSMQKDGNSIHLSDEPVMTTGGVICERVTDRVTIDNTVEARFSRMKRDMIVAVSKILFENGVSDD